MGSAGHFASTPLTKSSHQMSRPCCMLMGSPVRLSTMTLFTPGHSLSASSVFFLSGTVARPLHVTTEAGVGDVELAAHEPLGVRRLPVERLLPRLEPGELLRALLPEPHGIPGRLAVDRLALHERSLHELLGRGELALFFEQRLDRLVAFGGLGHIDLACVG